MGIWDGLYSQLALGYVQIVVGICTDSSGLMNRVHTTTQHLLPMLAIMMLSTIQ